MLKIKMKKIIPIKRKSDEISKSEKPIAPTISKA